MDGCGCNAMAARLSEQRGLLRWLLGLNLAMFLVEVVAGWLADSSGLLADSLDMLADAAVYGIAYLAVGKALAAKQNAARISGLGQVLLALLVLADAYQRLLNGSAPHSLTIMLVATLALGVNLLCLRLLNKHRHGEIHLRASWLFSASDVLANLGVIAGGMLVALSGSAWPDLIIGTLIALLIARTGVQIIRTAHNERGGASSSP